MPELREARDAIIDTAPQNLDEVALQINDILDVVNSLSLEEAKALNEYPHYRQMRLEFLDSLHVGKVSEILVFRLEQLGLAQMQGEWLQLDRSIAALYMLILARTMSVSESADDHR